MNSQYPNSICKRHFSLAVIRLLHSFEKLSKKAVESASALFQLCPLSLTSLHYTIYYSNFRPTSPGAQIFPPLVLGFSRSRSLISAPARSQLVKGFPEELNQNWITDLTPVGTFFSCCMHLLNKQSNEAIVMRNMRLWGPQTLM